MSAITIGFPFHLAGEEMDSWGYGGTGRFSTNNKFAPYGETYGVGDVVAALLDLDSRPPTISFAKNGRWLGVASPLWGFKAGCPERALFPHILSKNCRWWIDGVLFKSSSLPLMHLYLGDDDDDGNVDVYLGY